MRERITVFLSCGLMVFLFAGLLQAQAEDLIRGRTDFNNVGNRSAEFLTIPVGARAVALGNAYTALADDITAVYWNPAGLAFMEQSQSFFTYIDMPLDASMTYAAAGVPVFEGQGTMAGFVQVMNFGELEQTTVISPNGTGIMWDSFSFAGGMSYAHNFSDRFAAGFTLKGIHENIADQSASAFAMDFGSNYHTTFRGKTIRLAFMVQNMGTPLQFGGSKLNVLIDPPEREGEDPGEVPPSNPREATLITTAFQLPTIFKAGLAYDLLSGNGSTDASWVVTGEFWQPNNQEATVSAGSEYTRRIGEEGSTSAVSLRGGYYFQQDEVDLGDSPDSFDQYRGLSVGGGFTYDFNTFSTTIDYAYRNMGRLTQSQHISMMIAF
jgi:hypothetical protein